MSDDRFTSLYVQDAGIFDFELLPHGGQPLFNDISRPAGAAVARSALSLCRSTRNLVGRTQQVEAVLGSLRRHGAAVIWGSPGEGKTALAAEAGCCLQEEVNADIYVSIIVDMNGAHTCEVEGLLKSPVLAAVLPASRFAASRGRALMWHTMQACQTRRAMATGRQIRRQCGACSSTSQLHWRLPTDEVRSVDHLAVLDEEQLAEVLRAVTTSFSPPIVAQRRLSTISCRSSG